MHTVGAVRFRIGRLVLAAILAGTGVATSHLGATPVAATDCVTYYCATVSVHLTGNGHAHIYDDQGELDCYYNAGSETPACNASYYWIGQQSSWLDVHVTLAATANSYICGGSICRDPGATDVVPIIVTRDSNNAVTNMSANLAKTLTITVSNPGDGSGHVTSSPSGIDCSVAGSATSGSCSHLWYFVDSQYVEITGTPAAGNFACGTVNVPWACYGVGLPISDAISVTASTTDTDHIAFSKGHPILTVGRSGKGQVFSDPPGVSCPSTCSSYFPPNTKVAVTAAPAAGYVFTGWTGACSGRGATCNLNLGSTDVSTSAVFALPATPVPTARATSSPRPKISQAPAAATPVASQALPIASGSSPVPSDGSDAGPAPSSSAQPFDAASPGESAGDGATSPSPESSLPVPAASNLGAGSGTGLDVAGLAAIVLLVLAALSIGIAFGRRGRRAMGAGNSAGAGGQGS